MKKLYTLEKYQNKLEWLNHRGIGGSSASAILEENPYKSKIELYFDIKNGSENIEEAEPNVNEIYGTQCEDLIRQLFRLNHLEYKVNNPIKNSFYRRIDKPYLTASLDGTLINLTNKQKGILEIKTRDIRSKEDNALWEKGLPQNYFIQVLHYLVVMNDFDFAVVSYKLRYFNDGVVEKEVIKNHYIYRKDFINDLKFLEKKESEFYEINIKKGLIPSERIFKGGGNVFEPIVLNGAYQIKDFDKAVKDCEEFLEDYDRSNVLIETQDDYGAVKEARKIVRAKKEQIATMRKSIVNNVVGKLSEQLSSLEKKLDNADKLMTSNLDAFKGKVKAIKITLSSLKLEDIEKVKKFIADNKLEINIKEN